MPIRVVLLCLFFFFSLQQTFNIASIKFLFSFSTTFDSSLILLLVCGIRQRTVALCKIMLDFFVLFCDPYSMFSSYLPIIETLCDHAQVQHFRTPIHNGHSNLLITLIMFISVTLSFNQHSTAFFLFLLCGFVFFCIAYVFCLLVIIFQLCCVCFVFFQLITFLGFQFFFYVFHYFAWIAQKELFESPSAPERGYFFREH